ncbi:DNA/RNA non-specific endonuclease [Chitinimonas viridis]|uniref:DNA/RNA non-specific endonuclease n=1 Tax=Chitinimonas viridis TaxID=664880 RepID=A0ABT8B156_9NEIS|nr:DNA/RNA non-specific endonuclease [Chitinimonas viridis]MDN3575853.1 DNA/RNA non-specific endonuclease [Chitinimonas viridis]
MPAWLDRQSQPPPPKAASNAAFSLPPPARHTPGREEEGFWIGGARDLAGAWTIGSNGLLHGAGWLVGKLGADEVGADMMEMGRSGMQYGQALLSDLGYNAMQSDELSLHKLGLAGVQSLPGMAVGGAVAAPITLTARVGGTALAARTLASQGALGKAAARILQLPKGAELAKALPAVVGNSVAEGSLAAMQSGAEAYDEIMQADPSQLDQSPQFQKLLQTLGSVDKARAAMADSYATHVAWRTGLSTGALSGLFGTTALVRQGEKVMGRQTAVQALARVSRELVQESSEEAVQSGAEQLAKNHARQQVIDPKQSLLQGVAKAALEGAATAGLLGTASRGASKLGSVAATAIHTPAPRAVNTVTRPAAVDQENQATTERRAPEATSATAGQIPDHRRAADTQAAPAGNTKATFSRTQATPPSEAESPAATTPSARTTTADRNTGQVAAAARHTPQRRVTVEESAKPPAASEDAPAQSPTPQAAQPHPADPLTQPTAEDASSPAPLHTSDSSNAPQLLPQTSLNKDGTLLLHGEKAQLQALMTSLNLQHIRSQPHTDGLLIGRKQVALVQQTLLQLQQRPTQPKPPPRPPAQPAGPALPDTLDTPTQATVDAAWQTLNQHDELRKAHDYIQKQEQAGDLAIAALARSVDTNQPGLTGTARSAAILALAARGDIDYEKDLGKHALNLANRTRLALREAGISNRWVGSHKNADILQALNQQHAAPTPAQLITRPESPPARQHIYIQNFNEYIAVSKQPLQPNTIYHFDGMEFETDHLGRSVSTRGKVDVKKRGRRMKVLDRLLGKGKEADSHDVGFHRGGDALGFPGGPLNVVPGNGKPDKDKFPNKKNLNQGPYKQLELELARLAKAGKQVHCNFSMEFDSDNLQGRPDRFVVSYQVDGGPAITHYFLNQPGG